VVAALASFGGCGKAPGPPPDVILIMIDTLRPDRLGCFGYPRNTSPAIDRFAEESLRFENAYSHAPVTRIAVATLVTGFLPHETGVLERPALPQSVETLAERLRRRGYRTGAVISNYVLRKGRGYEQGFQIYDDQMTDFEEVRKWPERIARHTTDRAIQILEEPGEEPLFLWIVYQDPHGPYTPPEFFVDEFRQTDAEPRLIPVNESLSGRGGIPSYQQLGSNRDYDYYAARYDGEIRYLDLQFQRLIDALKAQGRYDTALILLTSDHGEGMGEHDYYFAHGEYLYQNQIHVPLILRQGRELKGVRHDAVRHIDIASTILEAADLPPDPRLRGRDLRQRHGRGGDVFAIMRSPLVEERYQFALVRDGYKLIYTPGHDRYELYDLGADPDEQSDLIDSPAHAKRRDELATALGRFRQEKPLEIGRGEEAPDLIDGEREKLEALGYLE